MTWLPVVGYESYYEVSDAGQVRKVSGELLGQWLNSDGYPFVRLSNPRKIVRVHRLVATAFVPNPNARRTVNHIDCDRSNNAASNLEWCSQAENLEHSDRLGRMQRDYWKGKRSPNAKLTPETVAAIRLQRSGGISLQAIADKFGTNKRTVGKIVNGESYV